MGSNGTPRTWPYLEFKLATSRGVRTLGENMQRNIVELGSIEPARILGLDQDSRSIGWAKGRGPDYHSSGVREFLGDRTQRLPAIYEWLKAILIEWRPAVYVLESPMGDHDNIDTHKILGEVMGICKAAGWETGHQFMIITPYWIRRTGYHKEARRDAALLAGKDKVDGHEADAIGAWLAGWTRYRNLEIQRRLVENGVTNTN